MILYRQLDSVRCGFPGLRLDGHLCRPFAACRGFDAAVAGEDLLSAYRRGWVVMPWASVSFWVWLCHSIRLFHLHSDDAGNGGGGRAAGDGDHVEASRAAGHGFVFFEGQRAGTGSRPNVGIGPACAGRGCGVLGPRWE